MKSKEFEEILLARIESIKTILGTKSKEYAMNGDRLHNFKVAARINNTTQAKALWGMSTKHLVSVIDLVNDNLYPDTAMINEKIGDMINYLILLEAVLKE